MELSQPTITINQTEDWRQLTERLRQVGLLGDPHLKPYAKAVIDTRVITSDQVWPVARYILTEHLETQRFLHWAFENEHSLDTLHQEDREARVVFKLEGEVEEWALIPPIVEESPLDGKPLLVDGEHRFFLARELGVPIKVIWISHVPAEFPIVATPIEWSEVTAYDQVPDTSKKRDYRYPTWETFPDISSFSQVRITQENFLYFFFRDLAPVCTSGVRRVGSK
jgi:hypothetical protein